MPGGSSGARSRRGLLNRGRAGGRQRRGAGGKVPGSPPAAAALRCQRPRVAPRPGSRVWGQPTPGGAAGTPLGSPHAALAGAWSPQRGLARLSAPRVCVRGSVLRVCVCAGGCSVRARLLLEGIPAALSPVSPRAAGQAEG